MSGVGAATRAGLLASVFPRALAPNVLGTIGVYVIGWSIPLRCEAGGGWGCERLLDGGRLSGPARQAMIYGFYGRLATLWRTGPVPLVFNAFD